MSTEWEADEVDRRGTKEPHITIHQHKDSPRIAISKPAYIELGSPKYVQIMYSKANGLYRIKLVPCSESKLNARKICVTRRYEYRLSGAANLIKKHKMLKGFYVMDKEKVFTWRYV